jgi:hypothetical protein
LQQRCQLHFCSWCWGTAGWWQCCSPGLACGRESENVDPEMPIGLLIYCIFCKVCCSMHCPSLPFKEF